MLLVVVEDLVFIGVVGSGGGCWCCWRVVVEC